MTLFASWTLIIAMGLTPTLLTLTCPMVTHGSWNKRACKGDVKDLYLMVFLPYSGSFNGGESLLAAATLATEQINAMCVVEGYRLVLLPSDTQCDAGLVIYQLYQQLYTPPTKIAILGPACSLVSETMAIAAHHWNLVQVSYASVSPSLSNKTVFPKFVRVSPPEIITNPAKVSLFRYFGWKRVAILHQGLDLFSETARDLVKRMKQANLTVIRSEIILDDPSRHIQNLIKDDCRIIVGLFYENKARNVFCEVYKAGLYRRRVVWLLGGWYEPEWWKQTHNSVSCTPQQMEEAVEGYFDIGITYINPNPEASVSGWLPSDFVKAYRKKVNNRTLPGEQMAPQGYDAAWALALALRAARQALEGSNKSLENFTYKDRELSDLLYGSLLNVSFMGIRGAISFDANGDPVGHVRISRVQGGVRMIVGNYNHESTTGDRLMWSRKHPIVWKGGVPPRDATVTRTETLSLSVPLYGAMCALASMGICLALFFLTFNIGLRHVKLVKMSSPRLNNVILLGCICAYISLFLKTSGDEHEVRGCELKTGLLVLGNSLIFGALFAKTWRVYHIFTSILPRRKSVSDTRLMVMVGALVMVNTIVLVIWQLKDPRTIQVTWSETTLEDDVAGLVEVKRQEQSCESDHQLFFVCLLYGIYALLLILGIFMAIETHHVYYPELNDSQHIAMCLYNVALLSIPAVVLSLAVSPKMDLRYAIGSSLVLLSTTSTQCILFVPKSQQISLRGIQAAALPGERTSP